MTANIVIYPYFVYSLAGCCLTITLANTSLKIGLKCSFTTSKLRFCTNFCLAFAAFTPLNNNLLGELRQRFDINFINNEQTHLLFINRPVSIRFCR